MKKASETAEVNEVYLPYLRLCGCYVWRQNQGALRVGKRYIRFTSEPGVSDIIGMTGTGRFLAVEAKRGRKGPTKAQRAFLAKVRAAGGLAIVCRSLAELERGLREAGVVTPAEAGPGHVAEYLR